MMNTWLAIVLIAAALGIGVVLGIVLRKRVAERAIGSAEAEATRIVDEANKEADSKKR